MDINTDAPAVARGEIEVAAAPEIVWRVLTDIANWPSWNPDVKAASKEGPLAAGTQFRWKAGPGTISSLVEHLDPPRLVAWSGRTLGIRAFHVWRLEARDGKTHAHTEESYDGVVARVLRRSLQKTLDSALADGAHYLKTEAEKTAPTPP